MPTITVGPSGADFTNLQDAVAAASGGDTISLQAGMVQLEAFADPGPDGILGHVLIDKNLTIIGQGEGVTTLVNVNSNPDAQNEALSQDVSLGAAMDVDGSGLNVQFLNFTFDGGDGPDAGGLNLGSGIFFNNGTSGFVSGVTLHDGTAHVGAFSITVDNSANVYTTGYFTGSADFDPGKGKFTLTSAGSWDIFVSKLTSAGNFAEAARMGGADADIGWGIAVDSPGAGLPNVYTTGQFRTTADFDPGPGTFDLTSAGAADIFVSKLTQPSPLLAVIARPSSIIHSSSWVAVSRTTKPAILCRRSTRMMRNRQCCKASSATASSVPAAGG